jgi:signal transduction histidine kinase
MQFGWNALPSVIASDPLLWIIATAPFFLGLFAYLGGIQRDKAQDILDELKGANTQLNEANDEIRHQISLVTEQSRDIEIINTQLQEMNTGLTEANNFKLKMLGIASHDLKSPLTNILLQAELIKRKAENTALVQERADDIYASGEQMRQLIGELLDATALSMGKVQLRYEICDLVRLLQVHIAAYQLSAAEKQQVIITQFPPSLLLQCDEARIQQVTDNLISNAIKYSIIGGEIHIVAREHPTIPGTIEVHVKDSGPGFTEDDKAHLFGMFQRLSAKPTGGESSSGVGLASVKNIVELHGGTIDVESRFGEGSTFVLCLPQFQFLSEVQ